ncbi:ribosome small subunit-dependent GTPase A [bacterium]|nr:ribosome small subunit-dependent GTPase A [bacterium]
MKDSNRPKSPEERHAAYQKGMDKRERQKAISIARYKKGAKRDVERRSRDEARKQQQTPEQIEQRNAEYAALPVGRILTRARTGILVQAEDHNLHWCRVPGKGSLAKVPVPGDQVRYKPSTETSDGWIEGIEERSSLFHRYVFGRIKEIAANMDRVLLIATPREPIVSPRLIDRMLVGAEVGNVEPWIVINKIDLFDSDELDTFSKPWEDAGYTVLRVSAETGQGLHMLLDELVGRTTLLAGPSGVGKSTLLNRLIEDLDLDTAAVSATNDRGVHTTTATQLYRVPNGGTVADTPGVREFYPVIHDAADLRFYFPEFQAEAENCHYNDCLHLDDSDGCAVKVAVEEGRINVDRYQSYKLIHASLLEGPTRGRAMTQG